VLGAWKTDLLEERLGNPPHVHDREVALTLGPHEIVTVEIALGVDDE
jgi:hypothetical protein